MMRNEDLAGFTKLVRGKKLYRYVVGFTHNESRTRKQLRWQYKKAPFGNITFGGWRDSQTGHIYLDFGTSTKSLTKAMEIASKYKQIAIRDNVEKKEIRLR